MLGKWIVFHFCIWFVHWSCILILKYELNLNGNCDVLCTEKIKRANAWAENQNIVFKWLITERWLHSYQSWSRFSQFNCELIHLILEWLSVRVYANCDLLWVCWINQYGFGNSCIYSYSCILISNKSMCVCVCLCFSSLLYGRNADRCEYIYLSQ